MRIAKGTARIAVIGDRYTVKIANIHLRLGLMCLYSHGRRGAKSLVSYINWPIDSSASFKYHFIRGISENRREYRTSKALGDIVVPTRFSFLGILNIQETAEPHNLTPKSLWVGLRAKIGDGLKFTDAHTFSEPDNYGIHKGKLKLIDYGGETANSTMLKYQRQFREVLGTLFRLAAQ